MAIDATKLAKGFELLEALWSPAAQAEGPVGAAALAAWIDEEIGPCFVDRGTSDEGAIKTFRGTWHEWQDYRRTPFDDFFWRLMDTLDEDLARRCIRALSSTEQERIPEYSAAGDAGLLFAGFAYSCGPSDPKADAPSDATCLYGIGPNDELILRLRRMGTFDLGENAPLAHDTNRMIPVELGSREFSERAIWRKMQERNRLGQLLKKRSLGKVQPIDYAVCLPFAALMHLQHAQGPQAVAAAFLAVARAAGRPKLAEQAGAEGPASALDLSLPFTAALLRYLLGPMTSTFADELASALGAPGHAAPATAPSPDAADPQAVATYLDAVSGWRDALLTRPDRAGTIQAFSYRDMFVTPQLVAVGQGPATTGATASQPDTNPLAGPLSPADNLPAGGARLLIEAPSGMGKTTLLRGLAAACAQARTAPDADGGNLLDELLNADGAGPRAKKDASPWRAGAPAPLPVLIGQPSPSRDGLDFENLDAIICMEGRDLARGIFGIMPYELKAPFLQAAPQDPAGLFCNLLSRPDALLLVDSVDEVPLPYRDRYIHAIERLVSGFGIYRLVITSRQLNPASSRALAELTFGSIARIQPFDEPRQRALYRTFTTRYLRTVVGCTAPEEHLIPFERLAASPLVRELMGNPLLITLVAKTAHRTHGNLPEELMEEIVFSLPKAQEHDYYDRYALWRLAFERCIGSLGRDLPSERFHELFGTYRAQEEALQRGAATAPDAPDRLRRDADEAIDRAVTRRGLLTLDGRNVRFSYTSVCAYLASRYICKTIDEAEGYTQMDEEVLNEAFDMALSLIKAAASSDSAQANLASTAVLFVLAHREPRSEAHRLFKHDFYQALFRGCLFAGTDDQGEAWRRACERIIADTHTFNLGEPIERPDEVALWESRLTVFA